MLLEVQISWQAQHFVKLHVQIFVAGAIQNAFSRGSGCTKCCIFSRERLRSCRTTSHLHLHIFNLHLCSSSHPRIYISAHLHLHTSTSLLIFTSAHLSSHPHISHLYLSSTSLLRPGAVPPEHHETQPSAEIVRVERTKCRRECDLSLSVATLCGDRACRVREMEARLRLPRSRATLCGDRACRLHEMQARVRFVSVRRNPLRRSRGRVREMQARLRFVPVAGNPLRRSCVSSARNAGESDLVLSRATLCGDRACRVREMQARARFDPVRPGPGQPSAEIVRVEGAKCRRECVVARSGATLCGERARRARVV